MNMQNKLYTAQFFSPLDDQLAASSSAVITEPGKSQILRNSWKDRTSGEVWTPGQERIPSHRQEKSRFPPPGRPPHITWARCLQYGIFPLASLGHLSGSAPSQLPYICSVAEYGRLDKVLDFIATTKNISITNILLLLNPKHSSYWEEN